VFDGQDIMSAAQNLSRSALADFLVATEPQRAHWYCIKEPLLGEAYCQEIKLLFPSLSSLLNIKDEVLTSVLKIAGLVYQRKNISSPLLRAWESFIAEYKLSNELTTFSIGGKQRIFLLVGSWSERQPAISPKAIWCSRSTYVKPKLRITTLTLAFAVSVGKLELTTTTSACTNRSIIDSNSEKSDDSNSDSKSESDIANEEKNFRTGMMPSIHFDANDYPLLHSLGLQKEYQFHALLREIVKYKGSTIEFMQNNNRPGFLILFPSSRSTKRFSTEVAKKGGAIDSLLNCISMSATCNRREAAESIFRALHKKQEEAFTSFALEQGLIADSKKKMDAVQVESMLAEAGLTKNNARILFRHLNQFFGKGRFESEHKRRAFFAGNEYPPVVDKITLPDKTIIDFWYKEPDKMLQHQINNIIKKQQLSQLTHIDLSVGGDHGGGKFRMTLKVLFRFKEQATVSRLFQIASVSHSKDETDILQKTVLDPIGESLRRISQGGHFIIHHNTHDDCLKLTFNLNVSIVLITARYVRTFIVLLIFNFFLIGK
jgi:hypothetical protein